MKGSEMVFAVVQCRMSSTRLPGKVLLPILEKPMLLHVVERLRDAKTISQILLATSTSAADDPISQFASEHGIQCFRGSEHDVLDRFYQATRGEIADSVVRITADCPFTDAGVVDRVVQQFLQARVDYAAQLRPQGLDAEVFTRGALGRAWSEARDPVDREHVTPYMRLSGKFQTLVVEPDTDISHVTNGWSVDTEADLRFVRAVYGLLYRPTRVFGIREIVQLLKEKPELMKINADQNRYEGFYRSMASSHEECAPPLRILTRSRQLRETAERLISSSTNALGKETAQYIQGVAPDFLLRGKGSHVWDVDGNEYIDYPMARGTVILGHDYPAVSEAVQAALRSGTSFSLPHFLEVELATLLCELIPCAEMVCLGKDGSDVRAAVIRAARVITSRDKFVYCGYHTWRNWYIETMSNEGTPKQVGELTLTFPYNDLESLEKLFRDNPAEIAAVIIKPAVEQPKPGFLEGVRDLARRSKALLIFDEIATGFRLSIGGAQQYFNIDPDLAALGKTMANGFALSAVVGKRSYVRVLDEILLSDRFSGESIGLAAAMATLQELRTKHVIEHIWRLGRKLKDGYMILVREYGLLGYTDCVGFPPCTVITFKERTGSESLTVKALFQQECLKRGILFSGKHNLCFSHSDADIDRTLRVYAAALRSVRSAIDAGNVTECLKGLAVQPVVRSC